MHLFRRYYSQCVYFPSTGPTAAAGPHSTMAQNQVILQFRFATFGDSMLQKMNLLRHQRRFCDVTVCINQVEVPGHKVVFAAGSSFLRDQFILQQDSSEVQISMIQEAEVGRQLLLSCYTGQLEFPELELVHYLTVASFLQMGHIVEQCTLALSKFIKPQATRTLEADADMKREKRDDGSSSEAPRKPEHTPMHQEAEGRCAIYCNILFMILVLKNTHKNLNIMSQQYSTLELQCVEEKTNILNKMDW